MAAIRAASARVAHGGAPPFDTIVTDYGPLIARIATIYEADPALREDLTQQILLSVWQGLPGWRAESSLKTFIGRIAQNRAVSFVASQAREPFVSEINEGQAGDLPTPEDAVAASSERERLLAATRRLPLPQRDLIVLILEGFSYAEIGEMLKLEPNALRLRLARAKATLKKVLERS